MNYVLIGLPGSGKSTIGVMLAKYLGYRFLDTDLLIQRTTGKLLSEIIAEDGPEEFIRVEDEILSGIQAEKTVISTGGSAVYGERAMRRLKENGRCIYLRISFEEMRKRTGSSFRRRGVVLLPGQTQRGLYEERTALYERYSDITIDEKGCSQEETLQKLLAVIRR
ncbi:shikimate kinase [Lachnoclostridium sp. Marseille-P6806]|uniref:shikimate kinase n=1 Tax=Lachnoclostridium sp. Marseille-P6806 TaxID=2364793 RepID=UPI0024156BEE|nr:shikimate kinase [Lachnoclostridium sp. Marseille-P6806]